MYFDAQNVSILCGASYPINFLNIIMAVTSCLFFALTFLGLFIRNIYIQLVNVLIDMLMFAFENKKMLLCSQHQIKNQFIVHGSVREFITKGKIVINEVTTFLVFFALIESFLCNVENSCFSGRSTKLLL